MEFRRKDPKIKKTRVTREMKTPSFGNNSGPDDQIALFKASERREKGIPLQNLAKATQRNADMVKEVDFITLNKKDNLQESKSMKLDESSHSIQEDNLIKYANKMGHKKSIQRFKKNSENTLKPSVTQYFKPKVVTRNTYNPLTSVNSKTFIDTHAYDKIETHNLPKIYQDQEVRFEKSNSKSIDG